MLIGTFTFANNAKEITIGSIEYSLELVQSFEPDGSAESKVLNNSKALGTCFIKALLAKTCLISKGLGTFQLAISEHQRPNTDFYQDICY